MGAVRRRRSRSSSSARSRSSPPTPPTPTTRSAAWSRPSRNLGRLDNTLPMILQWDESFDIGSDTLTGVNDARLHPPFPVRPPSSTS